MTTKKPCQQCERLKYICKELHWMAHGYVSGRRSYAVSMFNDLVRELQGMGVDLSNVDGDSPFAKDGNGKTP